jgi:hypothetical protein
MDLPQNTLLPFFAYGIFRPNELGFLRIKPFVSEVEPYLSVPGKLLIRDGLPLLVSSDNESISGSLIHFRPENAGNAYYRIIEIEPDYQYHWDLLPIAGSSGQQRGANVLKALNPGKGTIALEGIWEGKSDPFFKEALETIKEIAGDLNETVSAFDFNRFFRLQAAYLLLWSVLERYTSLRYHLGKDVMGKINYLATDPVFAQQLIALSPGTRQLFRVDTPESSATLCKDNPKKAINYYYQVRSNITHRGKAAWRDFETVQKSLIELLQITETVLTSAFLESEWP